ncbi:MAG TPA: hypothetical protein VNV43_00550 [Candidatus Acidoferrales bacterium]|jgi:hypothetical protein|nr:hypothetical protein [Candidatus Acidoferrales bacterium]
MARQLRFLICAMGAIVGIWVLAMAGHWYLESLKMTADKVRAYMESVDFARLTGEARANAIKQLEDKLNALPYDERQRLRLQHLIDTWFNEMTEEEKSQFVEATMPTGIKQMIEAFQQLPDEKRRRLIDNTLNNLRNANDRPMRGLQNGTNAPPGATNAPVISPELEAKIRNIGLKTFYSQSSAETKAEVAPVLEELQHQMENGRVILRQQ